MRELTINEMEQVSGGNACDVGSAVLGAGAVAAGGFALIAAEIPPVALISGVAALVFAGGSAALGFLSATGRCGS